MDSAKKYLKIAGIINCIIGLLLFNVPLYGISIVGVGIFLYALSQESAKDIYESKNILIITSFVLIPFNFISSIFLFLTILELKGIRVEVNGQNAPNEDKESKKIDILLKLGVGMVFLSGILFATTSWSIISDLTKAIVLLVAGTLFLGLSYFTEKVIKLKKSSYMYWMLSMAFYILTIVGLLYLGVYSSYLTYNGLGSELAYCITFLSVSGFSYATYLKYTKRYFAFASYAGIFAALYNALSFISFEPLLNICILSLIVFALNIITKKENILHKFTNILSYMLFVPIFVSFTDANEYITLLACIVNVLNVNYLIYQKEDFKVPIINIIITYILSFIGILNLGIDNAGLILGLFLSIYTLIVNYNLLSDNKTLKEVNYIFYSISSIIVFIILCESNIYLALVYSLIFLLVNSITKFKIFNCHKCNSSNFFELLGFLSIVYAFFIIFKYEAYMNYLLIITNLVYCIIHSITNDEKSKDLYKVVIIICNVLNILTNLVGTERFAGVLVVLSSLYMLVYSIIDSNNEEININYIILLSSIFFPFVSINVLNLNKLLISIIFILLMALVVILVKNEAIRKINYVYTVLPLYIIIKYFEQDYSFSEISYSILIIYATFLISKFFIKDKKTINTVAIIGTVIALLPVIFTPNLAVGIYVGIVGVLLIIIGFSDDDFSSIFKFGIIVTVLNIFIQLIELWKGPFWAYLLIVGLGIIGFVMYKEIKKSKKS